MAAVTAEVDELEIMAVGARFTSVAVGLLGSVIP
jgi:hypothetical protein